MEWLEWCFFFFLLFAFCFLMKWSLDCHYEIINDVNGTRPYFLSTFLLLFCLSYCRAHQIHFRSSSGNSIARHHRKHV
ncbi:hypothetical protein J3E69DRAFT_290168 [Trichoderma sp. SZMC 28015]